MKRVVVPELLDEDLGSPKEVRESLLDLRGFNQRLGGFRSVVEMLETVAKQRNSTGLSFLDVAGGAGDVAENAVRDLSQDGISLQATVLDRAVSHMNGHGGRLSRVAGDALSLPFSTQSFDVVGSNLFCHHLESEEMISFFNEALRVARMAVIVSDLRRTRFHWIAAQAGRVIYRSRITRHDAAVSVRRAYTLDEIGDIARRTNAARFDLRPYYFQRLGMILWKA